MLIGFVDERNIPPLGRIGDPDDIIASVRVQDGKVSFTALGTQRTWGMNCDAEILRCRSWRKLISRCPRTGCVLRMVF